MLSCTPTHCLKEKEGFVVTADSQSIHYRHFSRHRESAVIIAHGFFNSAQSILLNQLKDDLLVQHDVILMDFRGHGKSSGAFCFTSREIQDLIAVIEYAKQSGYQTISVMGFSLGAVIAAQAATMRDDIQNIILVSCPIRFEDIDFHYWEMNMEIDILFNIFGGGLRGKGIRPGPFWLNKLVPIDLMSRVKTPVLFIHGTEDWIVRPWHSEALHKEVKTQKDLIFIQNGSHAEYLMLKQKKEFVDGIQSWFEKTFK